MTRRCRRQEASCYQIMLPLTDQDVKLKILISFRGGCDQASSQQPRRKESFSWERRGREIKSEKDVFRSEIVCWLSTSSLTSQRGWRAAKRQGARQVGRLSRPATPARDIAPYRTNLQRAHLR
ncbi:hypothetical protein ACJJTC_006716 [Scirpophaga incertulas]